MIQGLAISTQCGNPVPGSHCSRPPYWASSGQHHSLTASPCSILPPFPPTPPPSPFALLFSLHFYFLENPPITRDVKKAPKNMGQKSNRARRKKKLVSPEMNLINSNIIFLLVISSSLLQILIKSTQGTSEVTTCTAKRKN